GFEILQIVENLPADEQYKSKWLQLLSGGNTKNETFIIKISNDKKYKLLKYMVKKCLAPLFDSIPSTQITLHSWSNI
ncbi:6085_t:CDS:2, partial [Cetraspora pellucida]